VEIVTFLTQVLDASVPRSIAEEARQQLRIAHEYESMSDRLADLLRVYIKLREGRLQLPADQLAGLQELHDAVADFLRRAADAYERGHTPDEKIIQNAAAEINSRIEKIRDDHIQRMIDNSVEPQLTLAFTALLTDYRRIRAHTTNVYEACSVA
jgi:phosphate:Na+ symporter